MKNICNIFFKSARNENWKWYNLKNQIGKKILSYYFKFFPESSFAVHISIIFGQFTNSVFDARGVDSGSIVRLKKKIATPYYWSFIFCHLFDYGLRTHYRLANHGHIAQTFICLNGQYIYKFAN